MTPNTLFSASHPFYETRTSNTVRLEKKHRNPKILLKKTSSLPSLGAFPLENPVQHLLSLKLWSRLWRPESWTNVSLHWRTSSLSMPELWTKRLPNYPWLRVLGGGNVDSLQVLPSKHRIPGSTLQNFFFGVYPSQRISNSASSYIVYSPSTSKTAFSIHDDFLYDTQKTCIVLSWSIVRSVGDSRFLTGSLA